MRHFSAARIATALSVVLSLAAGAAQSSATKKYPPVPRASDGKPDLSGVWQPASDKVGTWEEANQGNGIPDQEAPVKTGGPPPYQPWAAQKVLESYKIRLSDNPVARCIPQLDLGGGPLYPVMFVQTPKLVVILVESRHVFRIVPLNAKHPEDADPSYLGDSVGHWEGDTLVIDITNFKEQTVGAEIHSDAWHIVERYTRTDYNTINYEATLEDSKAYTKPYTIHSKFMLREGTRVQEYVCEENNQDPARMEQLNKEDLVRRK